MKTLTILFISLVFIAYIPKDAGAKKIKKVFKTEKKAKSSDAASDSFKGFQINASDEICTGSWKGKAFSFSPDSISFSGYDKNISSSREAFLITNASAVELCAIKIRIDYFDMNGLMLHSRVYSAECIVPPDETRKIDIPTWDRQNSYYYYLSNEPRKVATPYKVAITPLLYWIIP